MATSQGQKKGIQDLNKAKQNKNPAAFKKKHFLHVSLLIGKMHWLDELMRFCLALTRYQDPSLLWLIRVKDTLGKYTKEERGK